ncbi:MAG TPA: carboxypeptidase regulatory-like domain-containing protein [Prolixibacteraceae bacterium]|nr:carboxypeptidase regulatory-like domain-containing protein [Prolixibacteraceae bacterium]
MKTYSKTIKNLVLQSGTILKISILSITFLFLKASPVFAQGKLTGFVIDDEFNEPLEKAVVTIPGTLISVLTDQQGKYTLDLAAGDYFLEVNYPGYFKKQYNMSVTDGITTPMFVIKLEANAVGRTAQHRLTSFENKREFPQTIENFSTWKMTEQTGNQEFNQAIETIPSTSFLSNGSGFADSEIGFRGNDATHTSYTFNGILLNNPENGRVGCSTLSGLTDWAGQIQVVSGQAASPVSGINSGGLVNVLSFVPHEEAGFDILSVLGNKGFLKTSATVHTGLSKNGWASSVQLSRTSGNGLVQNTAFEQYGFFANIHKEFNHRHTLVLNLNGTIQQHDQNRSVSIGAYNRFGTKYNSQWGFLDTKPLSWSTNYGRSPMISLTHFWQPRIKTYITTQIFAQFNRSAQLMPGGTQGIVLPGDTTGLVLFDEISDWNNGLEVTEMGAIRQADENGKFTNSENSGISTLAAINRENRFGLRSVLTHEFSKKLDFSGSFDLEQYKASHFGAVSDLLGADGYTSYSDVNRPSGYAVENLFQSSFFTLYNSADQTAYYYESGIQSGGLTLRLDHHDSGKFWFIEGSSSLQNIRRIDHYAYLTDDSERKTKFTLLAGGRLQSGLQINLWKYHSIHLRINYGTHQPLFNVLFPAGNNWKNDQATNDQNFDAEFGYTIFSRRLKIEALAYRSQVYNRSMVSYSNLHPDDSFGLATGLEEIHQGVELKSSYKSSKNFQFNLNGSLGDWKYSKDAKASIYNSDNQLTETNDLWLKNVRIANAPQLSLFAEAEYRWAHNLYVRLNYRRIDKIYAPFGLYDFNGLTDRTDFEQWRLPGFNLLGASANYLLKMSKSHTINFIFGANNILDDEHIEQSATNLNEKNPRYTSNQVYYGMGRTWFAGFKYQF